MRDKHLKLEDLKGSNTVWRGGGGYRRRGKRMRDERFEEMRCEYVILKM
jgi:hypothetical protein